MQWRTLLRKSGRLISTSISQFLEVSTTVQNPTVPNLPWLTPAGGGPTYSGILKRWTGAVWGKELLKVYLAGSWQAKPLKRWTGAAWVEVDTTGI